jgi:hypothetical protein
MKPSKVLTIKILLSVIIFLLILGYGLFQARNIIIGPELTILTPKNGDNVTNPLVTVTGVATNITRISLDDRQIFVDNKGNFSEKLLVPSGYTIIKVAAQDKFGRTTQKLVELNYTSSASGTDSINASSTMTTSSATSTQDIIQ